MAVANTMAALRVAMQGQDQAILAETRTALTLARAELAQKEEELVQVRVAANAISEAEFLRNESLRERLLSPHGEFTPGPHFGDTSTYDFITWEIYAARLEEKLDTLALSWRDDEDVSHADAIMEAKMEQEMHLDDCRADSEYERSQGPICSCNGRSCWSCI